LAATAEAQAEASKAAQRAGIDLAKSKTDVRAYRGRKPTFTRAQLAEMREMLGRRVGVSAIAMQVNVSRQVVYRIKDDPVAAEGALTTWRM